MKTYDNILPLFLSEKEIQVKKRALSLLRCRTSAFSGFLKENNLSEVLICDIKNTDVSDFFIQLARKGLDRTTCKKYAENIKAVFKYAQRRGWCGEPPFELVQFPHKLKDCAARVLTDEELSQLAELTHKKDRQLHMAIMTEYYCGARPGKEARLLQAKNFDLNSGMLRIDSENAKTGKTRYVTMSDDFIAICKDYGIDKANPDDYVFAKGKKMGSKPLSENALRCRFNTYRKRLNLPENVKLYSAKHTAASRLIRIMDINSVKDFLGHATIVSTQRYIHRIGGGINETLKYNFPSPTKVNGCAEGERRI